MQRVTLHVYGKVQGVFYRKYAKEKADHLQLTGYVANQIDGFVTCVIEGKPTAINDFITWAWNGSPNAHVQDVVIFQNEEDITPKYNEFTIKR